MLRGYAAIFVCALYMAVVGLPTLLIGFIYPFRVVAAIGSLVWAKLILLICGVRVSVAGAERFADGRPRFFLGNHQSALDIPIVVDALGGDVRFMGKHTLFRIPVFGWVIRRYGYIPVDRRSPRATLRSVERALARLRQRPVSLAVFPEGTRSPDGRLLPFHRGTMKICLRARLPVVPFAIDGAWRLNPPRRIRAYPGRVRIVFDRAIPAEEIADMTAAQLHDRVRDAIVRLLQPDDAPSRRARVAGCEPVPQL